MAFHERENDAILWGEEHGSSGGPTATASPKGLQCYESSAVSYGSSYSSWSDLSSPFGSELESTSETTESEEDEEFISELTRKMAESMLQDDDEEPQQQLVQDPKASVLLPVKWSESGGKAGAGFYSYGLVPKSEQPCLETASNVISVENSAGEQLGPVHVNGVKKLQGGVGGGTAVAAADTAALLQREKQSAQNRGGGVGGRGWKHGGGGGGQGKKNSIPVFPAGSGMRAVFLGGSDRTGCSGTGVFLPAGNRYIKPEPKRKAVSGCSTVLIPARVLQTLQQHFNTVGAPSPSVATVGGGAAAGGGGTPDLPWRNDVLERINGLLSQKKEHAEFQPRAQQPPATYAAAVETSSLHPVVPDLPQEWTY